MKIRDAMSRDVSLTAPDQTIREAAGRMAQLDAGVLPVGDKDKLIGVITDRDIAVRAVAEGKGPTTLVREVMSQEVLYCYDDQDLEEVAKNMADVQVRRMPVVSRDKRLVGIISLADIAQKGSARTAGRAVTGISQPGGAHSQAH